MRNGLSKKNHRPALFLKLNQACLPTFLLRQKSLKTEAVGGQAAGGQCTYSGTGTRNNGYRVPQTVRLSYSQKARIGNGRHAGIGNQGHILLILQQIGEGLQAFVLVMGMEREQRFFDFKVMEQEAGRPGILAGNRVNLPEHVLCPGTQVTQISDGCSNNVQSCQNVVFLRDFALQPDGVPAGGCCASK